MNLIFFDDPETRVNLLPFTFTRPVADIRVGIQTNRERWMAFTGGSSSSSLTEDYLAKKFPLQVSDENILINGALIAYEELSKAIIDCPANGLLFSGGQVLGGKVTKGKWELFANGDYENFDRIEYSGDLIYIQHPWDIFSQCGTVLSADFSRMTGGRTSQTISETNTIIGDISQIFIEEGAIVEGASLNTKNGPIYISKNAEVMEGSMIRGPFALGEHSQLKMSAKVYGPSLFGPHCKVGGEVNNSVIFGYSNKAHDGFLGNSVIGEWCNLGADTNNSNLKNNYAEVKLWHYGKQSFIKTGLQFCGLIMGDHSKCGINTMFNTGTVVGVSANIFGSGFPRNYIPSFSWGGAGGMVTYKVETAIDTAKLVYARRKKEFDEVEQNILKHIHSETEKSRK